MKKLILISALLLAFGHLSAKMLFVKQGAKGEGTSWNNAFGDLQVALLHAQNGDTIWVASGTYFPTNKNDRKELFRIKEGVKLYGGFLGHETSLDQRNWRENLTILSGELGKEGKEDNSYTVIYTKNVSSNTVLDGFAITGAASDGVNDLGDIHRSGAGWFNDGSNGESSPTITNCLFINNYARDGAAIYNYANNGKCQPNIVNCQFISNKADLEGGAIYNDGRNGMASPIIQSCYFMENQSNYGASIRNKADNGKANPVIAQSVFEANTAYVRDIIYEGNDGAGKSILRACRFSDNVVTVGRNRNNSTAINSPKRNKLEEGKIAYFRF